MLHRLFFKLFVVVAVALLVAAPALAGGWAVVTLDTLPTHIVTGQPFDIGFVVRQHGQTPLGGLAPTLRLSRAGTGDAFSVVAQEQGGAGHYAATLAFPAGGAWTWSIDAFGAFVQPMPPLDVVDAAPVAEVATRAPVGLPMIVGVIGFAGAAAALFVAFKVKARAAPAFVLAGILVGAMGLTSAAGAPASAAPSGSGNDGQALFLAKGCVICHQHDAVRQARAEFGEFSFGPDLTELKADPDFLRRWLKEPSAIKPDTFMPALGLSDAEIDSLVAFLTSAP